MPDDAALGVPAAGLQGAHGQPGAAGGDDGVRRQGGVHAGEQVGLEVRALRRILLHEVGVPQGLLQIGVEPYGVGIGAVLDGAGGGQGRPDVGDAPAQRFGRAGRGVGDGDAQAAGGEQGGPACADGAGADDGDAGNGRGNDVFGWVHVGLRA